MSRIEARCASLFVVAALALGQSGCTWVKASEESAEVQVVELAAVARCEKIGSTTVSVLSKVGFMNRGKRKVARELESLARNAAAKRGADRVVADGPPEGGEQDFDLYRCGPGGGEPSA